MSNHFGKMTKRGVSLIYTWPCVWLLLWNSTDCLELRNDTLWRYCSPQSRTKSSDPMHDVTSLCVWNAVKCYLIYFAQCQISTRAVGYDGMILLIVVNSRRPRRLRESQSLQQGLILSAVQVAFCSAEVDLSSASVRTLLRLSCLHQFELMKSSHWSSDILTWDSSVMWKSFLAAAFNSDVTLPIIAQSRGYNWTQ